MEGRRRGARERASAGVCVRVCVCVIRCVFTKGLRVHKKQGAQARLGYLCQRSYSKMGEGWSDQPPVPASVSASEVARG